MDVFGYSVSPVVLVSAVALLSALVGVVWYAVYRHYRGPETADETLPAAQNGQAQADGGSAAEARYESLDAKLQDEDGEVSLSPPNLKKSWLGLLATWRYLKKQRKLAGKGYVQWYLIGDAWPRPKFVKPEDNGGGEFEYEHDGETYLFPKEAMLPRKDNGMWTVVHHKGDAKPLDLAQPDEFSVSAKQLNNYVTSRVTIEPPGWLSGISTDPSTLVKYAIFAFIAFVLIQGLMSGGMP